MKYAVLAALVLGTVMTTACEKKKEHKASEQMMQHSDQLQTDMKQTSQDMQKTMHHGMEAAKDAAPTADKP